MNEKLRLTATQGVRVAVFGRPHTKGSLAPGHIRGSAGRPCKIFLREDGEFSVPWKKHMIAKIRSQAVCERYAGAVEVHAFFRFEREIGEKWPNGEGDHGVVQNWPTAHQYGDEDKLRRNLLDALTQSGLIFDDKLVVGGQTWKRWARDGEGAGVEFVVMPARDLPEMAFTERLALARSSWS